MFTFIFAVLLLAVASPPPVAGGEGHWQGVMHRGSSQLNVRIDIGGSPVRGRFSAPDLGAIDIPLARVRLGRSAHFELVSDTTTTAFDATEAGDTMWGAFHETGRADGTFALHRVSAAQARPYAMQPVEFVNGGVHLSGTVFVPQSAGRHPAAVLVHGSGAEGRWATAYIADDLARHGVIALTYDKRGVGASTGDWRTATLDDLAGDARAAVHVLARRHDVDPRRLGVYGHSQGAEIAPAIARNNHEVRWIVAADGPVGPQYHQDLYRVDTMLEKNFSGQQRRDAEKLYAQFVDVARNGSPHAPLRAAIARAGNAAWLAHLGIPDDANWVWGWYAKAGNYDNTAAWASVRVPVMLVFGGDDAVVPARESITEVRRILKTHDNPRVTVRVFAGADHTERIAASAPDGWPHNAAGFPDVIAAFATGPKAGSAR